MTARPRTVTVAGVLAYVWGGLTILSSLISMAAGTLVGSPGSASAVNDQSGLSMFAAGSENLLVVLGSALVVAAALVIWGGAAALKGTSGSLLVVASAIQVVIQIVWTIGTGSAAFGIVGGIVPVAIIALMLTSASRNWFRAVGGSNF